MRCPLVATLLITAAAPLVAAETCVTIEPKAVAALFDDWNFALSSLDSNQVVQRYWPNAVLLPTVSNTPRTNASMIGDYFEHFLAKRPRGRIDTRTVQSGCNIAMDMGTYTFSLMDDKGVTSEVAARYTFIYQYRDGAWKILHHHSSSMPESSAAATPTTQHAATSTDPVATKPIQAAKPAEAHSAKVAVQSSPKPKAKEPSKPATPVAAAPAPKANETPKPEPKSEAKTSMFANLSTSPPPSKFYPAESAKRKERGNVNLKVCSDSTGAVVGTPEIAKSSGSKLLDEAAQTWARAAKWIPATMNNHPVEGCTQIDVSFEAAA